MVIMFSYLKDILLCFTGTYHYIIDVLKYAQIELGHPQITQANLN
jgi:hypothetical protein